MSSASSASAPSSEQAPAVLVRGLNFTYGAAAGHRIVLHDVNLALPRGSRTLLVGEGNFSFARALVRLFGGDGTRLVATAFDSEEAVLQARAPTPHTAGHAAAAT